MSKKTISIIIIICTLLITCVPILWSASGISLSNDYARITSVDYKAIVVDEPDCEGKIIVTERLTFDIHAASKNNLFWELWRDLCEDTIDGVKVHYKVNSVKQIMPDGSEVVWKESPVLYWEDEDYVKTNAKLGPGKWYHSKGPYNEYNRQYECLLFYVDGIYRDEIVFEIEYEMYNASLRYADCSDLYIAMYSGETIKYLESLNAEILFPNKDMPSEGNYYVTTYGTNNNNFPVEESATKNPGYYTFSFELDKDDLKFKKYNEYIEFDLVAFGEDKHSFTEYASVNKYYNDNALEEIKAEQSIYTDAPQKYNEIKLEIFKTCCIIAGVIALISIIVVIIVKKKGGFGKTTHISEKDRNIPSDLDPKFAAALVHLKSNWQEDDANIYSALLLGLDRKGYITLQSTNTKEMLIILSENDLMPEEEPILSGYEQSIDKDGFTTYNEDIAILDQTKAKAKQIYDKYGDEIAKPQIPRERLTWSEKQYLNLIKRHTSEAITIKQLQTEIAYDYTYSSNFEKAFKNSVINYGINNGYFPKAQYQKTRKSLTKFANFIVSIGLLSLMVNPFIFNTQLDLAFGAFALLGSACIVTGLFVKWQANKCVLLTEFGQEEYRKWRAFYNYLKSGGLTKEKHMIDHNLMDKYMVYAMAFGLSKKIISAIKIKYPEMHSNLPTWQPYINLKQMRRHRRRFRHVMHASYRAHRHGSGNFDRSSFGTFGGFRGSFGGGFGGGGRGGGGGGGGH